MSVRGGRVPLCGAGGKRVALLVGRRCACGATTHDVGKPGIARATLPNRLPLTNLTGFRTATLATSLDTCAFPNPFKSNCNVTAGRTIAFETDQSCQVRRLASQL